MPRLALTIEGGIREELNLVGSGTMENMEKALLHAYTVG